MTKERKYEISILDNVYYCKQRQQKVLNQKQITDIIAADTFADIVELIITRTTYPAEQSNKFETYGFSADLYDNAERNGANAFDSLSLLILDCDNSRNDVAKIYPDDASDSLKNLNLSHFIYETYSSKKDHPKFRVIVDIYRKITSEEAFKLYQVFDHYVFNGHLDGAIYDLGDYVYAIPHNPNLIISADRSPVCVEEWLGFYADLPERKAWSGKPVIEPYLPRFNPILSNGRAFGKLTVKNQRLCNRLKLESFQTLYVGGSHHQSWFGLMNHIHTKCRTQNFNLTFAEFEHLGFEADQLLGGYCQRTYGRQTLTSELTNIFKK